LQSAIVAENHAAWHNLLRQTAAECGLLPLMIRNGREAIELAYSTTARLVILGVMLPDMRPTYVCTQIRVAPGYLSIPILILSSRGDPASCAAAAEAGANLLLTTPLSIWALKQGILPLIGETPDEAAPSYVWNRKSEPPRLFGEQPDFTRGRQALEVCRRITVPTLSRRTNWSR
jgi:DNA-binding response OmpR family regulator